MRLMPFLEYFLLSRDVCAALKLTLGQQDPRQDGVAVDVKGVHPVRKVASGKQMKRCALSLRWHLEAGAS